MHKLFLCLLFSGIMFGLISLVPNWSLILGALYLLFFSYLVVETLLSYKIQKKKWNDGIAPDGSNWIKFYESEGCKGYKDSDGNNLMINFFSIIREGADE